MVLNNLLVWKNDLILSNLFDDLSINLSLGRGALALGHLFQNKFGLTLSLDDRIRLLN